MKGWLFQARLDTTQARKANPTLNTPSGLAGWHAMAASYLPELDLTERWSGGSKQLFPAAEQGMTPQEKPRGDVCTLDPPGMAEGRTWAPLAKSNILQYFRAYPRYRPRQKATWHRGSPANFQGPVAPCRRGKKSPASSRLMHLNVRSQAGLRNTVPASTHCCSLCSVCWRQRWNTADLSVKRL